MWHPQDNGNSLFAMASDLSKNVQYEIKAKLGGGQPEHTMGSSLEQLYRALCKWCHRLCWLLPTELALQP